MKSYIELGSTPSQENCAQVGNNDYANLAQKEMNAYINQLNRLFPAIKKSKTLSFSIKWYEHDFGRYGEVVINYIEGSNEEDSVYDVDRAIPSHWDDEAKKELGLVL